jgi:hypothetical protein
MEIIVEFVINLCIFLIIKFFYKILICVNNVGTINILQIIKYVVTINYKILYIVY